MFFQDVLFLSVYMTIEKFNIQKSSRLTQYFPYDRQAFLFFWVCIEFVFVVAIMVTLTVYS